MSRIEKLLKAIINNTTYDEPRLSRIEEIFYSILNSLPYNANAQSRIEALLLALKESGLYDERTLSRIEEILKCKLDGRTYTGWIGSRVEMLLNEWELNEIIEATFTSFPIIIKANGQPLLDYLISGNMSQSGEPTPTTPIQPQETGERTRNMFDKDSVVFSGFYPNSDTGAVVNTTSGKFLSIIVPCEPNTSYTWSFDKIVTDLRNRVAGYSAYPTVGMACTFLDRETDSPSGSTRTVQKFTTTANTNWLILMVTGTGQTAETLQEAVAENAQFEIGTEMTSYEPYGYKIPISSASTTTPVYLGEVESTRQIKKLVLDGTESWNFEASNKRFYLIISDAYAYGNRRTQCYCSHYNCVYNGEPVSELSYNTIYINLYSGRARFYIYTDDYSAVDDFKSFLAAQYAAGTPVTVWYILSEPTTGIVNEPLRKIGEYADTVSYEQAGVEIPTLNKPNNTVIDVETELKPSKMYVKYNREGTRVYITADDKLYITSNNEIYVLKR